MGGPLSELKRRKVIRVAGLYILAAWVFLQVADLAFESWGIPSGALRFVWVGAIFGLPIALFLGWRFDVIGGRIVRTPDDDRQPPLQRTDYLILTIFAVVTVVITVVLLSEIYVTRPSQPQHHPLADVDSRSIAVLPFQDLSANQDQAYFGDGIAEELLNRLAKVKNFRVAGRTSSFSFKDQPDDLRTIGEKLNVAVVLEGSVRTAGGQVRITAQLISTADGFHLWSESYDREMDNVFAIQDEIAGSVVNAILTALSGDAETLDLEPAAVAKSDAYVLYLKGRHLLYKRSGGAEYQQSIELFEDAITIDPDYAPAYAGLALALVLGPDEEMLLQAEVAISRALSLDPGNSEALTSLGLLRQIKGRQAEAREALQHAIASNPNTALAHTWLGRSYSVSDPARYLAHVRNAYRIDPLDATTLFHLSSAATRSGQYDEALLAAGERHALDPESGMGVWLAGEAHHASGRLGKAIKTYYYSYLMAPDSPGSPVPREFIALREFELAKAWRRAAKRAAPQAVSIADATLAFLDGDPEEAFRFWSRQASYDEEVGWGHLIYSGDFSSARQAYERALLIPGQTVPRFDPDDWLNYADYALTLQRTGAPERALDLIDAAISLLESQLAAGVVLAPYTGIELRVVLSALYAMSSATDRAMEELRMAAIEREVLLYPWALRHWPHWDDLRDEPEFETFIAEQEAKLAVIRQRLDDEGMLLTPEEVLRLGDFSFDPFLIDGPVP